MKPVSQCSSGYNGIGEPVWMKMVVDHGNSVMISGTAGNCVKIHKKPVEGGSFLKMDHAVLFVVC